MTAHDAVKAHLQEEFNLSEEDISSPTHAAIASLLSFIAGGIFPFITIIVAPNDQRIAFTFFAVVIALVFTGYMSAYVGKAPRMRAIGRVLLGGILAMVITYTVGRIFGTAVS